MIGIYYYLYGKQLSLTLSIALLLSGLYLAGAHSSSASYQWIYAVLGERTYDYCNFFSGMLIVYSILMSPKLSQVLDQKVLVWLGKLSFSIYLLHLITLYVVGVPIFNYLLSIGLQYIISAIIASVIFILITLWISAYYSQWVDQLAIKTSQKISDLILK